MPNDRFIAYFTMEIALEPGMPTYSGGLGALAGDTIRSAADLKVPEVAVCLLHRKGYFYQRLDALGNQTEEPVEWAVNDFLTEMPERATVSIEGRELQLRAWRYEVKGVSGYVVPVYFLDTDLPGKQPLGPAAYRPALWRRRLVPPVPGNHPGHWRRPDAPGPGVPGPETLPHERGACGVFDHRTPERGGREGREDTASASRRLKRSGPNASSPPTPRCRRDTTSFPWTWCRRWGAISST